MKKIDLNKARQLILSGTPVKAKVSRDNYVLVTRLNELENLIRLKEQKVQNFELFYEISCIPQNATEVSLDDAIKFISNGKIIYARQDNKELSFSSVNDIIEFFRLKKLRDGTCHFYWYE